MLKEALAAHCENRASAWDKSLALVIFAFRTAIDDNGLSPALLTLGEQVAVPGLFVDEAATLREEPLTDFVKDLVSEIRLMVRHVVEQDVATQDQRPEGAQE